MSNEVIETKSGKARVDENGIFRYTFFPGGIITLDKLKENFTAHIELTGGKRTPFLVDIRGVKSIDREARAYAGDEEVVRITTATALVIDSPVSRVIGNFFLGINKPSYPVKLFTAEAKALEWLKTFVEQEVN